ncbi:hypothetical protein BH23ACT9_BH23ACT9_40050 [soil metagenome]
MKRVCVLSADVPGRAALIRQLEAAGFDVVGEGRTAADARRLARSCDQLIVDDDPLLVREIRATLRHPIVALQRTHSRDALVDAGATMVVPWPSDVATVQAAAREAGALSRVAEETERPTLRRDHPTGVGDGAGAPPPRHPRIVAIGASAGGPAALSSLLRDLRPLPVPIVIAQHLHPDFAGSLLTWLSRSAAAPLHPASNGLRLQPGMIVLAGSTHDLAVYREGHCLLVPKDSTFTPRLDTRLRGRPRGPLPAGAQG